MELYKWQNACLSAWNDSAHQGIVNVVTGAGKTVLAMAAIDSLYKMYPDLRVRIVVPTIPLAGQWKQALLAHARSEQELPGFYGGTRKDPSNRSRMIYIVNSARTALSRHLRADFALGHHVLLICDECHHYQSPENRRIFDFLTPEIQKSGAYACLGLSATPFPDEEAAEYLQQVLGPEIYRYGFERAERDGVISPFSVCQIGAGFLSDELEAYCTLSKKIHFCIPPQRLLLILCVKHRL